jgi:predicted nicotinamide N-methyase
MVPPPRPCLPAQLSWLRLPEENAAPASLETDMGGDDHTWAYAWPAGTRLAPELASIVPLAGARLADLGCGLGGLGCTALGAGAAEVLFADGAAGAVAWLAALIAANGFAARARVANHRWGEPLPGAPWPLLVGGDILYRPRSFPVLLDSIALSLAPEGLCLLSDPRATLEDELPELARARGLWWQQERRAAGYTLIRLRRLGAP